MCGADPTCERELGTVGLRINPLIGGGAIDALSTATSTSKFGVPLTAASRPEILDLFRRFPFLQGLMCHVGSQGMPLALMARGVQVLCELADEVDALCAAPRIRMLDIGGGLSANYSSDAVCPTFADYMAAILQVYPRFLVQKRLIITGTGHYLVCLCLCLGLGLGFGLRVMNVLSLSVR